MEGHRSFDSFASINHDSESANPRRAPNAPSISTVRFYRILPAIAEECQSSPSTGRGSACEIGTASRSTNTEHPAGNHLGRHRRIASGRKPSPANHQFRFFAEACLHSHTPRQGNHELENSDLTNQRAVLPWVNHHRGRFDLRCPQQPTEKCSS